MFEHILSPRPPEVVDFPRCNNADTDWYMRMPIDPPLADPKVEMMLGQCKEEDATQEATIPMTCNWPQH